jgi:hypothetical protein
MWLQFGAKTRFPNKPQIDLYNTVPCILLVKTKIEQKNKKSNSIGRARTHSDGQAPLLGHGKHNAIQLRAVVEAGLVTLVITILQIPGTFGLLIDVFIFIVLQSIPTNKPSVSCMPKNLLLVNQSKYIRRTRGIRNAEYRLRTRS